MRCALILINYNGGDLLLETLRSLYAQPAGANFDLHILDNGSTDDSIANIRQQYPKVILQMAHKNLGFGRGINAVIDSLVDSGYNGEYICLIQPDMTFTSGWLAELIAEAERDKQVAAVNPLVVYAEKFRFLEGETDTPEVYLQHEDYRTFAPFVGNPAARSREIILKGLHYLQPNRSKFKLAVAESLDKLHLRVYDEQLQGYALKVGDKELQFPQLLAMASKIAYKASKNLNLKFKNLHIDPTSQAPEFMVNALGSSFRGDSRLPENNYYGASLDMIPNQAHQVELFYGACALLRLKPVLEVGKFDPEYFMYYEESDLAMRLRLVGYKVMATPLSTVYHKERGSRSDKTLQFMLDSQRLFMSKWDTADIEKVKLLPKV